MALNHVYWVEINSYLYSVENFTRLLWNVINTRHKVFVVYHGIAKPDG